MTRKTVKKKEKKGNSVRMKEESRDTLRNKCRQTQLNILIDKYIDSLIDKHTVVETLHRETGIRTVRKETQTGNYTDTEEGKMLRREGR